MVAGVFYVPPVFTPALPGRGHVCRIGRDVRRGGVKARVSICRRTERPIGHITAERRVIPELVLVEQLKARHVEQGVERRPKIAVVARVLLHRAVEHVVRHSPAHLVILHVAQIFRGLIGVYEDVVRVIEACVFTASGTNEYDLQRKGGRVGMKF